MTLGCSLHVLHKFSICLTHKVTFPQRRRQSTWLPSRNITLSELMAQTMLKLTITMMRYRYSHTFLKRSMLWKRTCPKIYCHGNEKVSREKSLQRASQLLNMECLCKCVCLSDFIYACVRDYIFMYVCETIFMYVCETTFMYVCETTICNIQMKLLQHPLYYY